MTHPAPFALPARAMPAIGSAVDPRVPPLARPGWPITALLVLYPLWWVLGMGTLIVFVLVVPMVLHLWRRGRVMVPPGFGLWLLFLTWVMLSTVMLGTNPGGTLPAEASDRLISVVFNLSGYVAVAVVLLYIGNLTEEEFPRERLVRQLGWFFLVVVAGGLLGTVAPGLQFTSAVEMVLPDWVAENSFVRSLVHPSAAQVQEVLGYESGRPSAPFGYTNVWGYAYSLLLGWFVIGWLRRPGPRRLAGVGLLALSAVPVVLSLNRGVWLGLGLTLAFAVFWLVRNGNVLALIAVGLGVVVAAVLLLSTPLTSVVQSRFDNPHSDSIRGFTISRTIEVVQESPVLGFGATRRTLGSADSIAVGRGSDCARCGNPVLGSTGQLWLVLIAQGIVGAALYVGFFLRAAWAFRRDRSPLAWAAMLSILLPLFYMLLYNALVVPMLITFMSIALLWRNDQHRRAADQEGSPAVLGPAPLGGAT